MSNPEHVMTLEYIKNLLAHISGEGNDWIWYNDKDEFGNAGEIYVKDTEEITGTPVCYIHPHGNLKTFLRRQHAYSHADAEFIANAPRIVRELLKTIEDLNTRQ